MSEENLPEPNGAETPKAEEETPEPAQADDEKRSEAKEAEPPVSDEAKDDAPKSEEAAPQDSEMKTDDTPKPTDESRTEHRSLFQLTAFQAENSSEEKSAEPKEEQPKQEAASEEEQEPSPEKTKPEPAEEKLSEAEKSASAAEETAEQQAPVASAEGKLETPAVPPAAAPAPEPPSEYYSFEEVKSQIQTRLAPDKVEKLFRPLENDMMIYHDAHVRYIREQDEEGATTVPEPPKPDFAKLAAGAGIEAKRTDHFSQREAIEKNLDIADSRVTLGDRPVDFLTYAFESLSLHRPTRSQDVEGNHYLFWKVNQTEERVPELSDEGIRQMVIGAWKMIEARDIAEAEAKRLADAARVNGGQLTAVLKDEQGITVETTEPFTWFDPVYMQLTMMGYAQPRLSTIKLAAPDAEEGEEPAEDQTVPLAGSDFMRAVSNLSEGEVGTAWNMPKTVVYVVRMVETSPDEADLRQQFLSAADPRQLAEVANIDRRNAFREWMNGLEKAVGLQWQVQDAE
jgi:hypothetical protein